MSSYPPGPRLLKGAFVTIDQTSPTPQSIVFQYNPDTLSRTLQPQLEGGDIGNRVESVRYTGAPVEEFSLDLEIDATDQLAIGDSTAISMGIYPLLSALEIMAYPKSSVVAQSTTLLASGTIEIAPMMAPLILFVWGQRRVLPVRLSSVTINEQIYDNNLNPIRARVSVSMRALSYSDLPLGDPGYNLFMAYQVSKETMAASRITGNTTSLIGVDPNTL